MSDAGVPDDPPQDDPREDDPADEPVEDPPVNQPDASPRGRRRLVLGAVALIFVLLAGLAIFSWWRHEPAAPLDALGLEDLLAPADAEEAEATLDEDADETDAGEIDAEQLAFLERQRLRAAEVASTAAAAKEFEERDGVTLTDRSVIRSLAGRWRLDLGGRQVIAEFAPVVVDRVRRGSLLVELYPVDSRALPPFYTVFELPEKGTFIAFRAADGSYRLVLEQVRFHGPELFSFQLGSSGPRRNAYRLEGTLPDVVDAESDDASRDEPVRIEVEASPPASEMWRQAETLYAQGRLQSLKRHLQRMRRAHPRHREARAWTRRIDRWIREQREDLVDDLRDTLDDLADGVEDRDLDEIFETWGDRPDAATRRFFTDLLDRHRRLSTRVALHAVEVEDGVAAFSVTLTFEGESGRGREREIIPQRWNGRFRDGRFLTSFP